MMCAKPFGPPSATVTAMANPAWLDGLTHKDWLWDGRPIRGKVLIGRFNNLDWSKAWMDMGPSIADNLGPYWHVPLPSEGTVHRLYPKVPGKWMGVIRRAVEEAVAKAVQPECDGDG